MFPINNGVRQGDELASILFDLFLEAILQKMNITSHIGTKSTKCSLFRNSNVFGSCIIHILYTGCAKI